MGFWNAAAMRDQAARKAELAGAYADEEDQRLRVFSKIKIGSAVLHPDLTNGGPNANSANVC
jgi:hypothetical protein